MSLQVNKQGEHVTERTGLLRVLFMVTVGITLLFACIQPVPDASTSQSSAGSYIAPALGIMIDEAARVMDIDIGSPAEKAGLQKGDVLISIENIPFATEKQKAIELIWGSSTDAIYTEYAKTGEWKGPALRLLVERNLESVEMEIIPMPPTSWWGIAQPTATAPIPGYRYF